MAATEIAVFGVTLFLALVALLRWKQRRDKVHKRINSKLRGYVAVEVASKPGRKKAASSKDDSLIRVA